MDHRTFNTYATAVRTTFGRDAGIAAIIDTYGPGTADRAPFIGSHLDPAGSAVCVIVTDPGDPVHVVTVYGYTARMTSSPDVVTYARTCGGTAHADVAAAVRDMAAVAIESDLDYVGA